MVEEMTDQEMLDKHDELISEYDAIMSVQQDEREQCLQDRRFATIPGAQWEQKNINEGYAKRPKPELNKVRATINRIVSEYRNNRISVDFVPRDGSRTEELSDFCDGLLRSNEVDSNAQEAYDNAFEEAVLGGIGAWRYYTKYVDEFDPDCDEQEIVIEPIFDADISVFFDLGAKRQDKSDARRCYVIESFTHDRFEDEFGYLPEEPKPQNLEPHVERYQYDWVTDDSVYVAEVYEVEESTSTLYVYRMPDGSESKYYEKDLEENKSFLKAVRAKMVKKKKVKQRKIRKYIISGDRILEDCGHIFGDCIPVVINFGQRWFINNIERAMGHVRLSKDAQRLLNMQASDITSLAALHKVEKPIFYPEQIASHRKAWSEDNIENKAYLMIDPITDSDGGKVVTGPVAYRPVPNIPPATAALIQLTERNFQEIMGNQQDGERVVGNVSTETAMLVQNRTDMQTYIYMDNFAKAMKRGGEIWLGMAKEVYCEKGRRVKTINKREKVSQSIIKNPMMVDGELYIENDITNAKMSVVSSVGPASSTANQAITKNLLGLLQAATNPVDQEAIIASIVYHTDGEGLQDLRDFYRKKLLRMGVAKPTREEKAQLEEEGQNNEARALEEVYTSQAELNRAQAAESVADVVLKEANANKSTAQTAQIYADIDAAQQKQAIEAIDRLGTQITPPVVTGLEIE